MIESLAERLILPDHIIEDAKRIYADNKIKNELGEIASLYIACRMNKVPRTMEEVAYSGNCIKSDLYKVYKKILLKNEYDVGVEDPLLYLDRIASRLDVDFRTLTYARRLLVEKGHICATVGSSPMARAGTVLYLSGVKNGCDIMQRDVADASQCNVATITQIYKRLVKKL